MVEKLLYSISLNIVFALSVFPSWIVFTLLYLSPISFMRLGLSYVFFIFLSLLHSRYVLLATLLVLFCHGEFVVIIINSILLLGNFITSFRIFIALFLIFSSSLKYMIN